MRASEAHGLRDEELLDKLDEARTNAFNLRLRHATGELENTAALGAARKEIARLLTIARQRGIDVNRGTEALGK